MTGEAFKTMLMAIISWDSLLAEAEQLGVQERRRKLDVVALLMAMLVAGGNHRFGVQAAVLRAYLEMGVPQVNRSSFYKWFTEGLEKLVEGTAKRALDWVLSRPVHLPDILKGVRDWRVVDSMTVKLPMALKEDFPGTGDYAALKVHKEYSLGAENLVAYSVSPAREHDAPHLVVDEHRRGQGLIVDLGYVSHELLRSCRQYDVHLVVRVKEGWQFWFDESATEAERRRWLDNGDLSHKFEYADIKAGNDDVVDVDVTVGPVGDLIRLRLVSFTAAKGRVAFLTTLPRTTHTYAQVGLLYRLRWNIELDNKISKSILNIDEIDARTRVSAMTMVHATMLGTLLANAFVREHHILQGQVGETRKSLNAPPLHPIAAAEMIARGGPVDEIVKNAPESTRLWERWAAIIVAVSADPNWRRRPSAMDVVKGRTCWLMDSHRYALDPKAEIGRAATRSSQKRRFVA